MTKKINITIENKLVMEKRDMNVYHHSTKSAHMISHDSSITLPFKSIGDDDYFHISIVNGPGRLEGVCVVNLPSWADFEFLSKGDVTVAHSGGRTLVKIPPGLPIWQLKMTRSLSSLPNQSTDRVTIGDDQWNPHFGGHI
ncbi:MAG: hypothetical protein GY950_13480 [bacterium]|nr:hypothetical protein [bacterium]